MNRPNIINHIIEDLDDQTAEILETYLDCLEKEHTNLKAVAEAAIAKLEDVEKSTFWRLT